MSECPYGNDCFDTPSGLTLCDQCRQDREFQQKENKARRKATRRVASKPTTSQLHKEDSWKILEQDTADRLNANPYRSHTEAHRQLRSGGIWFLPGDVADPVMLMECKEREQYNARGEQNFTIERKWLEKIMEEAKQVGRYPGLNFRFKGDPTIYTIKNFDVEEEMVWFIKSLQEDMAKKDAEIALLKERLNASGSHQ